VREFRIPARLNLAIAAAQLSAMLALLWGAGQVHQWWAVALLALGYGVAMNSAYAMLHEAEHGMLHPSRRVNDWVGAMLALFFPAPFHLIRQGHIGHHVRNRSDDEAFDLYFEGENRFWKFLQLYGTLTGLFWVLIFLTNIFVLLCPSLAMPARINRTTDAFLESLNPRYRRLIQFEAFAVIALHAGLIWAWHIPLSHYFAVMFGFGFTWSAMQYAHHYGTERDVLKGARNLRTFRQLDVIWLNHNWHRNHHAQPTVPWIYLPRLAETSEPRGSLIAAYLAMWHGPQPATEHVENRFAGRVIQ
jgi:fatty acid desaturase